MSHFDQLFDYERELDVDLLDNLVNIIFSNTSSADKQRAQEMMTQFQSDSRAWSRVPRILERSRSTNTKFLALKILEDVIQHKWKAIASDEERQGIKGFLIENIVTLSRDPAQMVAQKLYLDKLNKVLVQVIKHEWTTIWSNFVTELITSSQQSESICQNNMNILKLLSEEIFDAWKGTLQFEKAKMLRMQFQTQFGQIFQLCHFVFSNSQSVPLIKATLKALLGFLTWIPPQYIFETELIPALLRFFAIPAFSSDSLKCLTEIASIPNNPPNPKSLQLQFEMINGVLDRLFHLIPPGTDLEAFCADDERQKLIQNLALFFTNSMKTHGEAIEKISTTASLKAHEFLVDLSFLEDEELFKICLEYWSFMAKSLYEGKDLRFEPQGLMRLGSAGDSPRIQLYENVLRRLREAMIKRMAKPCEVLLIENEDGEVVRQESPEIEEQILYNSMRETLVYLANLNVVQTSDMMTSMLREIGTAIERLPKHEKDNWPRQRLNRVCWAIGSVSGVHQEAAEREFLCIVIHQLLHMCATAQQKDNKAVIASNIMYIVGRYPRFLRSFWKFLKTVANKLFEFMHEKHPGVQDMACDTFITITKCCANEMIVIQLEEREPFVFEILSRLPAHTSDLNEQQKNEFFKAIGYCIASSPEPMNIEALKRLTIFPYEQWQDLGNRAIREPGILNTKEFSSALASILKSYVQIASSTGPVFYCHLQELLNGPFTIVMLYNHYSQALSAYVAEKGRDAVTHHIVRPFRSVKREILLLMRKFVQSDPKPQLVHEIFIQAPFLQSILSDYGNSIEPARDPEVLSLLSCLIQFFKSSIVDQVPGMLGYVFDCTLQMIKHNYIDFPEIRLNFYHLISSIAKYCFEAFFKLETLSLELVIMSLDWGFKHASHNIAEISLQTLQDILLQFSQSNFAEAFYQRFLLSLVQSLLQVLTDGLHKSALTLQASLLAHIFVIVLEDRVQGPLWKPEDGSFPSNKEFLKQHLSLLLHNEFNQLTFNHVAAMVEGLMLSSKNSSLFKQNLRDLLVTIKEDLYEEQAVEEDKSHVPGLVYQQH